MHAVLGDLLERVERRAGLGETAGRRERDATRVLSHAPRIRQVGGGKRQREQLVPMAERDERQVGILQIRLGERDLPRNFYGRRRRRALRGGDGERAPAREGSREREEVMVVRVVPDRVKPLWLLSVDVDLVGMDGVLVGRDGVGVAPHPDVNVRGHVHEVPRAGHERGEPLGAGEGFLRRHGLDRVDVVVACPGMTRVRP